MTVMLITFLIVIAIVELLQNSITLASDLRVFRMANWQSSEATPVSSWVHGIWYLEAEKPQQASLTFERYLSGSPSPRPLTQYHLGWAYYRSGEHAKAGQAFLRAGLFQRISVLDRQGDLHSVYRPSQLYAFAESALAAAERAVDLNDYTTASDLMDHVYIGDFGDQELLAANYKVRSSLMLNLSRPHDAIAFARQSLDINPPQSAGDSRLQTIFQASAAIIQLHNCQTTLDNRIYALIVFYGFDLNNHNVSDRCLSRITQSLKQILSPLEWAYLLREEASRAINSGDSSSAESLLSEAQTFGLPSAWTHVYSFGASSAVSNTLLQPTFPVSDVLLAGYEIDPIQVELGIPLDVILFYREEADSVKLELLEAINLAPNPGFEFTAMADPCEFSGCQPLGFATDIYNGKDAPEIRSFVTVTRPVIARAGAPNVETQALLLRNTNAPLGKPASPSSSLTSFLRPVTPSRYLHAGWVRSRGGNGFFGRYWHGTTRAEPYDYILGAYATDEWIHVSQVVQPPRDAKQMSQWLLNFRSLGDVFFDGSVWIRLPDETVPP
jgi:tetratricopeptide (TPR) repeat protein